MISAEDIKIALWIEENLERGFLYRVGYKNSVKFLLEKNKILNSAGITCGRLQRMEKLTFVKYNVAR